MDILEKIDGYLNEGSMKDLEYDMKKKYGKMRQPGSTQSWEVTEKIYGMNIKELEKQVDKYMDNYHPAAYGTSVAGWGVDSEKGIWVALNRSKSAD